MERRRAVRPRPPPVVDHRSRRSGPAADDARRRRVDDLQRRDLQLPRAAQGARRAPLPHAHRHRGDPRRLPGAGAPAVRRAPAGHVRLRALGRRAERPPAARARPLRHQAALLRGGRRRAVLRLRGQGAAAVPAGRRDRPRRAARLPDVPVLPRRQDAVRGRARAARRVTCCVVEHGAGRGAAATGRSTSTIDYEHTPRSSSTSASPSCSTSRSSCTCAATCRSAPT